MQPEIRQCMVCGRQFSVTFETPDVRSIATTGKHIISFVVASMTPPDPKEPCQVCADAPRIIGEAIKYSMDQILKNLAGYVGSEMSEARKVKEPK